MLSAVQIAVKTPMIWGWVGDFDYYAAFGVCIICSVNMEGGKLWANK